MTDRPRLLVISPTYPWPLYAGGHQRIYHLLRELSGRFQITFASLSPLPAEDGKGGTGLEFVDTVIRIPISQHRGSQVARLALHLPLWLLGRPAEVIVKRSARMRKALAAVLESQRFDCIQVEYTQCMDYLDLLLKYSSAPRVLVAHDISYISQRRKGEVSHGWRAWFWRREARLMRRYEERGWRRFSRIITMSETDRAHILETLPQAQVDVVPNGVDVRSVQVRAEGPEPVIVFVGWMRHLPNADAVQWFFQEIWPLIRKRNPKVRFVIAGKQLPAAIQAALKSDSRVEYLGFVEDIQALVGAAWISLVPIRVGSGTRLKILESMALGTPVVSTSVGCEGIQADHGQALCIGDSPQQFAEQVLDLLQDSERRRALAQAGRSLVEAQYAWHRIGQAACAVIDQAIGDG